MPEVLVSFLGKVTQPWSSSWSLFLNGQREVKGTTDRQYRGEMSREQLYTCHCRESSEGWLIDLSVLIENLPMQIEEVTG